MDRELFAFFSRLGGEVRDQVSTGAEGDAYSEGVFTEIVLDHLSSIGMTDNAFVCHHESVQGRATVKINGYAFNDDGDRLDLFSTIYIDATEPHPVPKEDVSRAAERAQRFFEAACDGLHRNLEPAGDAFELAKRINDLSGRIERVRVFVITNGLSQTKTLPPREATGTPIRFEVWDIERLYRGMLAGVPRDEIEIDFLKFSGSTIPCLPMPEASVDYKAYMAVIPGAVLYKLYDEYGVRLLELNVRSFLGVKGSKTVNSGIRRTLRDEPGHFMAYNNGIVVTVDGIELEPLPDGRPSIRSVRGLQIVNGGQTTASIHRAVKADKIDVSNVFVPAKISVIVPDRLDEMVQRISLFANSQNTVQPADFSANHPFHVRIEELSKSIWCPDGLGRWFYERARGSYQVALAREGVTPAQQKKFRERTPAQRKFNKPELAKYLNSWDQKPHLVSFGAQKNFDHFMQNLASARGEDWLPDPAFYHQLIAKAILFRTAHKIVRAEKFPAYQANVTTYLVAYVSWRTSQLLDLAGIWAMQQLSPALCDLLRSWSHEIDARLRSSAGARMVTEWSKREACWENIKEMELPLPEPLPKELAGRAIVPSGISSESKTRERLTPEDYRNIELCKKVDGATWLRVHAWGKKSGSLLKWQYGIAHTLAGYAAGGWEKGPSPKQAKHGVVILKAAADAGILAPQESPA